MNLSERKRHILGIFVLLLVNIIWVLSSELTNFIFKEEKYNAPFLSTYLKSSMFTLFLCGFIFSVKWRMLAFPYKYYSSKIFPEENGDQIQIQPNDTLSDPIFIPVKFDSFDDIGTAKLGDDYVLINPNEIPNDIPIDIDEYTIQRKRSVKFNKMLEVRHLSGTYAEESIAARMSFQASKRHKRRMIIRKIFEQGLFPATTVIKIALQFCFCWFVASYSYQILNISCYSKMGLSDSLPSVVNIISSSSSLFTLILAGIFPSGERDKFTFTKLFVVLMSVSGVVLVSLSDEQDAHQTQASFYKGIIWSLVGALGYAIYLVSLRRKVRDESQMSLMMFFGFVGMWTIICFWPGFFVLHWAKIEQIKMPNSTQLGSLLLNGLIGTVGAELLWLWGCFLTSSLTATLSLGLTIPLSMVMDYFIMKKVYNWMLYVGSVPILLSFGAICYLTVDDGPSPDPIGWFFKCIFCRRRETNIQTHNRRNTNGSRSDQCEPLLDSMESDADDDADNDVGIKNRQQSKESQSIPNNDLSKEDYPSISTYSSTHPIHTSINISIEK